MSQKRFPLAELPDDMIGEVLGQADPETLAKFFGTSNYARKFTTPGLTQTIQQRRTDVLEERRIRELVRQAEATRQQVADRIWDKVSQYSEFSQEGFATPKIVTNPLLASLLCDSFPREQGYTLVTAGTLLPWFSIYVYMNKLVDGKTITVDNNLSQLSQKIPGVPWLVGQKTTFANLQVLLKHNTAPCPFQPSLESLRTLDYIKEYFSETISLVRGKKPDEYYNILRKVNGQCPPTK